MASLSRTDRIGGRAVSVQNRLARDDAGPGQSGGIPSEASFEHFGSDSCAKIPRLRGLRPVLDPALDVREHRIPGVLALDGLAASSASSSAASARFSASVSGIAASSAAARSPTGRQATPAGSMPSADGIARGDAGCQPASKARLDFIGAHCPIAESATDLFRKRRLLP
jgi:hypothetical protein